MVIMRRGVCFSILFVILLIAAALAPSLAAQINPPGPKALWIPSNFRGLTMGHAHRADVLRLLGAPTESKKSAGGEELVYKGRGDHMGNLTLRLDMTGTLIEVEEMLPRAIPRTVLYKEFGAEPVTAHYSAAACAGGALYRDARGNLELTLYPGSGLYLWPDQYGYDFAAIHWSLRRPGLPNAPACVSRTAPHKGKGSPNRP
jgi:hypothetical protein